MTQELTIQEKAKRHDIGGWEGVDKIMSTLDDPRFFSWKDLKPLMMREFFRLNGSKSKKKGFFLTSMRSVGKSTVCSCLLLLSYICMGVRYLYIRRTEKTLWKTMRAFFDDAIDLINEKDEIPFIISYFHCEGGEYTITVDWKDEDYTPEKYDRNGDLVEMSEEDTADERKKDLKRRAENCGSCLHLKGYADAKSGFNKRDIGYMLYDEFMAEESTEYLGSADDQMVEWRCIMSIFMSIAREKGNPFKDNVSMFFLGNNALDFNPILIGAGVNYFIAQSPEADLISPKNAVWLYYNIQPSVDFREAQMNSLAYQWQQYDETLKNYNFNNVAKTRHDDDELIEKEIPRGCEYKSGLIFNNRQYGVYYRDRDGMVYVSKKFIPGRHCEAMDLSSYYNNNTVLLVHHWRDSGVLNLIYKRFLLKRVRFCDRNTQTTFLQYLDFIPK